MYVVYVKIILKKEDYPKCLVCKVGDAVQPTGLKISVLRELFSQWPKDKVDWLVADRNTVIYASPGAERKFGVGFGQPVTEHPFLHKALMSKRSLVEQHQTWQDDQLVSTTVVAVPMEGENVTDGYVLMYGVDNSPSVEKTGEITILTQEINRQTSSVAALQCFVSACF